MPKFSSPFVRSAYNYDTMQASDDAALVCLDPSLAEQNFLEETDINYIVDKFTRTGTIPEAPDLSAFQVFEGPTDYHSALNSIIAAQEQFMTLPPAVRSKFDNDPQGLLDFLGDDKNYDEAVNLGLIPRKSPADGGDLSPVTSNTVKGDKAPSPKPVVKASSTPKSDADDPVNFG